MHSEVLKSFETLGVFRSKLIETFYCALLKKVLSVLVVEGGSSPRVYSVMFYPGCVLFEQGSFSNVTKGRYYLCILNLHAPQGTKVFVCEGGLESAKYLHTLCVYIRECKAHTSLFTERYNHSSGTY